MIIFSQRVAVRSWTLARSHTPVFDLLFGILLRVCRPGYPPDGRARCRLFEHPVDLLE